jgi:hypothetical protein
MRQVAPPHAGIADPGCLFHVGRRLVIWFEMPFALSAGLQVEVEGAPAFRLRSPRSLRSTRTE